MKSRHSTSILIAVGGAIAVSQACGWGPEADSRWDKASMTMCKVIDDMAMDREAECSQYESQTLKWICRTKWNSVINKARSQKIAAATAFANCDSGALDDVTKFFKEDLPDLLEGIGGITDFGSAIENEVTFLDDSVDLVVQVIHGPTSGSVTNSPLAVSSGATQAQFLPNWKVRWDASLVDQGTIQSSWTLDTSNLQQASGVQSIGLLAGNLSVLQTGLGMVEFDLDTGRPSSLSVRWSGSAWSGTLKGYFTLNGKGFWAMYLPVTLTPAGAFTVTTSGFKSAGEVFPVEPSNAPPAIYSFSFDSELEIGQTSNLWANGLDATSPYGVFVSANFNPLPTTFLNLPWELDLATQIYYGGGTTDSDGTLMMPVPVPNDPMLIDLAFGFQGIGLVGGAMLQTSVASSVVQ